MSSTEATPFRMCGILSNPRTGSVAGGSRPIRARASDAAIRFQDVGRGAEGVLDILGGDVQVRDGANLPAYLPHSDAGPEHLVEELGVRPAAGPDFEEDHVGLGTRSPDHDAGNLAEALCEPPGPGVVLVQPIDVVVQR